MPICMNVCEHVYIVSATNCGISVVGVSKCPVRFPSKAIPARTLSRWTESCQISQKRHEGRSCFCYINLWFPDGNTYHMGGWLGFSPSHDPNLLVTNLCLHGWYRTDILSCWWFIKLHQFSTYKYPCCVFPLFSCCSNLFEYTISFPIEKTLQGKLSKNLSIDDLLVVGSCCSYNPINN